MWIESDVMMNKCFDAVSSLCDLMIGDIVKQIPRPLTLVLVDASC